MATSLRLAQIVLSVAAALVALGLLVVVILLLQGASNLVVLMLAAIALYPLVRTVVALQRGDPWAPVAAFWGLGSLVLSGAFEVLREGSVGIVHIPLLAIAALIAVIVLPRDARTLLPEEGARRPPMSVALAYLVGLALTFLEPLGISP